MCTEFLFKDEYLSTKTVDGRGLDITQPTTNYFQLGHKKIKNVHKNLLDLIEETYKGYDVIKSGKVIFAEEIVPEFEKEAFESFKVLFDKLKLLVS